MREKILRGWISKIVGQMKIRLYTPSQIVLNWGFNTLPASCLTTWPLSRSCAPAARKLSIQFRGRRCCCWESGPPQKIDALQRRWQLCWWSWRPSILKRTMSSDDFFELWRAYYLGGFCAESVGESLITEPAERNSELLTLALFDESQI